MLVAQLHGKLSTEIWLGSEDLLTSAVFGTFKNLPASVTTDVLKTARPLAGSLPPIPDPPFENWHFWPWWDTCEPDVVVEDQRNVYLIEAKLYSEFGEDLGAGAQLRREWREGSSRSREAGKQFWLIAVTNHASLPEAEIKRQLADTSADLSHVCWFGWSDVARLLRTRLAEQCEGWREDLLELLIRMGLAPFDGFDEVMTTSRLMRVGLPWMEESFWGVEGIGFVGFGTVSEYLCSLRPFSIKPWRLAPVAPFDGVGFGECLAQALRYVSKGGMLWRPRLK